MTAAFAFARPGATPGPLLRDFEAYYAAGGTWLAGGDPYSSAIWYREAQVPGVDANRYELLPYVGPPMSLPLWALFSRLSFQNAARLWAGILVLAALTVVAATTALLRTGNRWSILSLVFLVIAFGPLTSDLALGQVAVVAFAAVLLSALLLRSKYWVITTLSALLAAIQPNIALLLLARIREHRTITALAAGSTIFLELCVRSSDGVRGFVHYFSILGDHANAERYAVIQLTPTAIAYGFGLPEIFASAVGLVVSTGAMALWLYILTCRAYAANAKLALTCTLLPFLVPFFHEHDLLVVFFPAAACALTTAGSLRAIASVGVLLVAIDWLGIAQRPSGTLQTCLLALAAICALAITKRTTDDQHTWRVVRLQLFPLLVFPVILICGTIAAHHPAPVWPDAMRALPPDVANLGAAGTWHEELARSELIRADIFWAALRSLSLCGCALLALVCLKALRRPVTLIRNGLGIPKNH
ncbi:MAG: glycosyltransferase 87 family protein [Candidatus Eremiobacteraeota bacterium]|nr:glycosyltransferase 87 family protein [Candidatus Eremiobacteraeota bacterium]